MSLFSPNRFLVCLVIAVLNSTVWLLNYETIANVDAAVIIYPRSVVLDFNWNSAVTSVGVSLG